MLFIQLIRYCLSSRYYVVYPADTIVTVIVSTQCFVFVISIYFVWYVSVSHTYFISYKIPIILCFSITTIIFSTDTSICNSYTWYPKSIYIRHTVCKPSVDFIVVLLDRY